MPNADCSCQGMPKMGTATTPGALRLTPYSACQRKPSRVHDVECITSMHDSQHDSVCVPTGVVATLSSRNITGCPG